MSARTTGQPYLERRAGGYYWRRRWPTAAHEKNISEPPRNLFPCLALRTDVLRDAKTLARRLTFLSDQVFAVLTGKTMTIALAIAEKLLTELARFEIEVSDQLRSRASARDAMTAEFEFAREAALQDTLRRALTLRDRDVARAPLRNVAARLGLKLDEDDPDWLALATEAIRVLLDVSEERARRDRGIFPEPSPAFRAAMAAGAQPATLVQSPHGYRPAPSVEPATFASSHAAPPASPASNEGPGLPTAPTPRAEPDRPAPFIPCAVEAVEGPATTAFGTSLGAAMERPGPDLSAAGCAQGTGDDIEGTKLAARIAARPPKIRVDRSKLSQASQAALAKPRGVKLREAFQVFKEIKLLGYGNEFSKLQKTDVKNGSNRARSSASAHDVATEIWCDLLGDRPVEDITSEEVNDALALIYRIPQPHGKGPQLMATNGYRDLVERWDAADAVRAHRQKADMAKGGLATPAEIEAAGLEGQMPRLRANTFVKHGRAVARIGRMLFDMQLIDENPFEICTWSTSEIAMLQGNEETRARTVWDDRIYQLWRTPVFQGETEEPGDPRFWAPLIARFCGLRKEEALQLAPDDIHCENGIDYLVVRNSVANNVKSTSSERKAPVHPALIQLGFLDLVALRRREGQPRLFPNLERGAIKGTLTAIFTKTFGYYRKSHDVYWPGLDFHALRTSFHGDLLNTNCSDALRRRLMGHAQQDEGEKSYAQGLSIVALHGQVCKIDLDISMIRSPFAEAASNHAAITGYAPFLRLV